ncbi:protein outspread isoform X2 [Folsomia candida]|uniref:protein outspread isoform X2 n=1 Tax=Folsomia candida TaxID=158441 RepID=UPI0016054EFB|nr:protein outspread isoform X2 [Folsomia candida]
MVADCPKFIPNIFNSSKCSSCFKTREEHGDIALDSKSLRKVVKCGYLFVAPRDWDFCNPAVYRAKRWQRRWFVLWTDDQLTWSIDDQLDTIPQGTLDMREILEVKNAEDITENPYSLALTGKQATFIKGQNNEDIKSWQSVLTKYGNRLITTGNGKRSLTLPGGFGGSSSTRFETGVVIGPSSRPRFHSVTTSSPIGLLPSPTRPYGKSTSVIYPSTASSGGDNDDDDRDHLFISSTSSSPISTLGAVTPKVSAVNSAPTSFGNNKNDHQISVPQASPIIANTAVSTTTTTSRSFYLSVSNVPTGKSCRSFPATNPSLRPSPASARLLSSTILPPSSSCASQTASSTDEEIPTSSITSQEFEKRFESVDVTDDSCPCPTNSVRALRGDPDGCGGLDNLDGGPLRKGWLLRQTNSDWTKHWFVLQNNSLVYYENSEELNPLGNIEINEDTTIRQFESSRHYGFEVINKSTIHKLSAITNGMRGIWMKALEAAKSRPRSAEEIIQEPSPSSIANPPSPPLKSKKARWRKKTDLKLFESLKDEFNERERELENFKRTELRVDSPRMRELLKSQALQIDNFRTQISSGFMEIEKLELYCKNRESEYGESLKCKDEIIEEIKEALSQEISLREKLMEQSRLVLTDLKRVLRQTEEEADMENIHCKEIENLLEARNMQQCHELDLLKYRCNDLTEKLYQSEKTAKSLKTKLGRVKSQSLKDRQIESDVLHKISDLEEKIGKLDASTPLSPTSPSSGPISLTSPIPSPRDGGSGIVNVIMKLNDLDQRVDKAVDSYWFRRGELEVIGTCQNCQLLELEVQDREERLDALEENLMHLESDFNNKVKELKEFVKEQPVNAESRPMTAQAVSKYQAEIEQLRNLCAKGLEAMENSHRRMVMELEEKHRRDLLALKIEKENELAEETKATLSALDAMRKNHQMELQKEITKFKEEFMSKFSTGQDLTDLHREHEQELTEVKDEILRLSDKYSLKCVEASKLEETISFLKTQLNDAKRRILDQEGSDFQSIISCASSANKLLALVLFLNVCLFMDCFLYVSLFLETRPNLRFTITLNALNGRISGPSRRRDQNQSPE